MSTQTVTTSLPPGRKSRRPPKLHLVGRSHLHHTKALKGMEIAVDSAKWYQHSFLPPIDPNKPLPPVPLQVRTSPKQFRTPVLASSSSSNYSSPAPDGDSTALDEEWWNSYTRSPRIQKRRNHSAVVIGPGMTSEDETIKSLASTPRLYAPLIPNHFPVHETFLSGSSTPAGSRASSGSDRDIPRSAPAVSTTATKFRDEEEAHEYTPSGSPKWTSMLHTELALGKFDAPDPSSMSGRAHQSFIATMSKITDDLIYGDDTSSTMSYTLCETDQLPAEHDIMVEGYRELVVSPAPEDFIRPLEVPRPPLKTSKKATQNAVSQNALAFRSNAGHLILLPASTYQEPDSSTSLDAQNSTQTPSTDTVARRKDGLQVSALPSGTERSAYTSVGTKVLSPFSPRYPKLYPFSDGNRSVESLQIPRLRQRRTGTQSLQPESKTKTSERRLIKKRGATMIPVVPSRIGAPLMSPLSSPSSGIFRTALPKYEPQRSKQLRSPTVPHATHDSRHMSFLPAHKVANEIKRHTTLISSTTAKAIAKVHRQMKRARASIMFHSPRSSTSYPATPREHLPIPFPSNKKQFIKASPSGPQNTPSSSLSPTLEEDEYSAFDSWPAAPKLIMSPKNVQEKSPSKTLFARMKDSRRQKQLKKSIKVLGPTGPHDVLPEEDDWGAPNVSMAPPPSPNWV